MNPTDAIDTQPDISGVGSMLLGSLETLGENALATAGSVVDQNILNGRVPFDPADPNVGNIRPAQTPKTSGNLSGLLLIGLLIWAVAH
jgi:hypothetical protein